MDTQIFAPFIHVRRRGATGILMLALALPGCTDLRRPAADAPDPATPAPGIAPAPTPASTKPDPRPPLSDADRAEIRRLLRNADYAIADGHLVDPPAYSALGFYDRVLAMDPDNPEARYGIESVVDRLIEQALGAAEQGRFEPARTLLAQAFMVEPEHIGVRPALTQVGLLESARRNVFRLDPAALEARSATVLGTLREAGRAARSAGCRAIIRARSDAEGRFIYQEMSAAPGKDRIRAELRIAGTPSIENICFQGAE